MVRITHNWVAPDSINSACSGLIVSDSRYWTVEGLFTKGFEASGEFSYNNASGLDKKLLEYSTDSLVMLYRPGAGYAWIGNMVFKMAENIKIGLAENVLLV